MCFGTIIISFILYDNNVRLELTRFYRKVGTIYIIYVEHITGKFIQQRDNMCDVDSIEWRVYRVYIFI